MNNILKNFIYIHICECAYYCFKTKSKCITFNTYCSVFKNSLTDGKLSRKQDEDCVWIMNFLNKIYGINDGTLEDCVASFFMDEEWKKYEEIIVLSNECLGNSMTELNGYVLRDIYNI